ncbi:hypothetical protein SAMN04487948_104134 [Halogranum amylolyticum]|uniref:Uncharacterized protein n=1 Tax=Halogranum amylolyticum TaxID=660520 RepID=A0A1H8RN36_9EURY|nr:hypothetical protein [Halogranum amylolyticum]SEO67871.1 hypothetical protein SAMN04487948_104134 [Halogranum amylolyticum]
MGHEDTGWRPKGVEPYKGHDIWEYKIGPHEVNEGEVDGDISFDDVDEAEDE